MKYFSLLFFSLLFFSCGKQQNSWDYYRISGPAQGTTYHITVACDDPQSLQTEIDSLLAQIDVSLSTYRDDSFISAWNENKLQEGQLPDTHFQQMIAQSDSLVRWTNGYFDPTVGPLLEVWGFGKKESAEVSSESIESALKISGWNLVEWENRPLPTKKTDEVQLNFNAIAQGYAVDQMAEWLKLKGLSDFMVELGGEVRVSGINKAGNDWRIGIEKPTENIAEIEGSARFEWIVEMAENTSLATSGSYRNFKEDAESGKRYSHIINPLTGQAGRDSLLSVTVMSDECSKADALATALMAMGYERAKTFAEENPELGVLLINLTNEGGFDSWVSTKMRPQLKEINEES